MHGALNILDMYRLDHKVAIVTGGSGLYGDHISSALGEAGALVIVASIGLEQCELKAQ